MKVLITGSNGQLGIALANEFPYSIKVDSDELDITNHDQVVSFDLTDIEAIINAAAYTKVDDAENPDNQEIVEKVNKEGVANLVELASKKDIPLVHVSTDYVFNGNKDGEYTEGDEFNPLNVYGKAKAEGDLVAQSYPKHYIFRTSWVIGEGNNFIRTMLKLSKNKIDPAVVNDQFGRLTFTKTLAEGIKFALQNNIPFGTYNLTNDGDIASWADIAKAVFEMSSEDPTRISPVSTEEYYRGKEGFIAKRPKNSTLNLSKIKKFGFNPSDWRLMLKEYINKEIEKGSN